MHIMTILVFFQGPLTTQADSGADFSGVSGCYMVGVSVWLYGHVIMEDSPCGYVTFEGLPNYHGNKTYGKENNRLKGRENRE